MSEWLSALKPGDEVSISRGYGYRSHEIARVDRMTATQFVVGTERFRRDDGRLVGNGDRYYMVRLEQVTDRIREEIERKELCGLIERGALKKLSLDDLRTVAGIIKRASVQPSGRADNT